MVSAMVSRPCLSLPTIAVYYFMLGSPLSSVRSAAAMSTAKQQYKGALVFLHGLGDTPAGWSSIQQVLPSMKPKLAEIKYCFPAAPIIPITINGGMQIPGWFDLYDWPIAVGSQDDKDGLLRSVAQIEESVAKLRDEDGIPLSKIVVGGFSQGGAAALLAAYRAKSKGTTFEPYAGCVGLSAWLTLPEEVKVPQEAAAKTPMLWAHGRYDDKVLFEQQAFGVNKLREAGVQVTDAAYDMGHESHPDEMVKLAEFLEAMLFGNENGDKVKSEL